MKKTFRYIMTVLDSSTNEEQAVSSYKWGSRVLYMAYMNEMFSTNSIWNFLQSFIPFKKYYEKRVNISDEFDDMLEAFTEKYKNKSKEFKSGGEL